MGYAKFLAKDVETGAKKPHQGSLLTGAFTVLSNDLEPLAKFDFKLKSEPYVVSAEALRVNKINILEHDAEASPKETITYLINAFLKENAYVSKKTGRITPLVPLGQNVDFDISWLTFHLPDVQWGRYVHYHKADTMTLAIAAQDMGLLPAGSVKLEHLTKHFGIEHKAHDARGDIDATVEVYRRLLQLLKGGK